MLKEQDSFDQPKRLVCRRTIAAIVIVILIPWTLISLPGDNLPNSQNTTRPYRTGSIDFSSRHGWPAIHYVAHKSSERASKRSSENWDVLNDERDGQSLTADIRLPEEFFNLAFEPRQESDTSSEGFWSNLDRWPSKYLHHEIPKSDTVSIHGRVVWSGLVFNLVFLGIVCFTFGIWCERKIRKRGGILRFNLIELLVAILAFSFLLAGVIHWRSSVWKQKEDLEDFETICEEVDISARFNSIIYRDPIPEILFRLLDYQVALPGSDPLLVPTVSELRVTVSPGRGMIRKDVVKQWNKISLPFDLQIDLRDSDRRGFKFLESIDTDNIVRLNADVGMFPNPEDLKLLGRFENVRALELHTWVTPKDSFDLSFTDNMKGLKTAHMRIGLATNPKIKGPDDWQVQIVRQAMENRKIDLLLFEQLDQHGAEELLKHSLGDRRIAIYSNGVQKKILESLKEHGIEVRR